MAQYSIQELESLFDRLWPLPRSITGNGLRDSFKIMQEEMPLELTEVPSGTEVFDWTIPEEWNVKEAYLVDPSGKKILNFSENNLHLVGYSIPYEEELSKAELEKHLHSLPDLPDAVPYVHSYYKRTWGFCLSHNQRKKLPEGKYKVVIKSELKKGALTFGHHLLAPEKGKSRGEILISTYLCHPSMANNELSGPLAIMALYKEISQWKDRQFTYRFVVAPETIGAIAYLHSHGEDLLAKCAGGAVVTCCGLKHPFTLKKSKRGNSTIDRCAENILKYGREEHKVRDFFPMGSDERQYCSPGFNLPVISITKGHYAEYPEYHTSLDNKELFSFEDLKKSVDLYASVFRALEKNFIYQAVVTKGEPQLGKRGLYPVLGNIREIGNELSRMKFLLFYADGKADLCEVAEIAKCSVLDLIPLAEKLEQAGLLRRINNF